jgi:hypothetical protein
MPLAFESVNFSGLRGGIERLKSIPDLLNFTPPARATINGDAPELSRIETFPDVSQQVFGLLVDCELRPSELTQAREKGTSELGRADR